MNGTPLLQGEAEIERPRVLVSAEQTAAVTVPGAEWKSLAGSRISPLFQLQRSLAQPLFSSFFTSS